mmetsp:Transcript_16035/g.37215  ORF Transcript_16035/g.37215 Transcript_16035/m.37215 type:complete len:679 (-) Transcript_16035:24-2060(-)
MPLVDRVGDRAKSLLDDPEDVGTLSSFLELVPRFIRAEVDDLMIRVHPLPTIETAFLDACKDLVREGRSKKEAAVEDAKRFLAAAHRQLGQGGGLGIRLLEELLALRSVLLGRDSGRPGWYSDLLAMDPIECDRLIGKFAEMTRVETLELASVARDLEPPGLHELLWLIENPMDPARDPLKDAKRRDHQHALLAFESSNKKAPSALAGGRQLDGYDPSQAADFMAPPPHKSEVLSLNAMGEERRFKLEDGADSQVTWVDTLSETLGVRPFKPVKIDTTNMVDPKSRAEVYQFVTMHGATGPGATGDRQFKERRAALEEGAELMRAKGRWWAAEAERRRVRLVRTKLLDIARDLNLRARGKSRERNRIAKASADERAKAERAQAKAALSLAALEFSVKWDAQQKRCDDREARERAMLADLSTLSVDDLSDAEIGARQRGGKSFLLDEWSAQSGVPLTPAAASVTFGSAPSEPREVANEMAAWQLQAVKLERRAAVRNKLSESMKRSADRSSWVSVQLADWRSQAADLEAKQELRRDKLQAKHVADLEARAAEKAGGAVKRLKMRQDALKRDFEAEKLAKADQERKKAELEREAQERRGMSMEEARQRCVDDFWGIGTRWTYYYRLEDYKRKIWQARIADRRKRMIQVGNSLGNTDEETEAVIQTKYKEPWQRDWAQGTT